MPDCTTPEREAVIALFRERCIENLQNQGVTKPFDRWHVLRAQGYIDARPGLSHKEQRTSDLADHLNALGRLRLRP